MEGLQHKYNQTVLVFPATGQTCHAYCTYCFRWAQFVGDKDLQFAQKEARSLFDYLAAHNEVSDVLFTGGDPMIMTTKMFSEYLKPFTDPSFLPHISNLRIGTRALSFWPQRFTSDKDAEELIHLLQNLSTLGRRHIAVMAHLSHVRELSTSTAKAAIAKLQNEAHVTIRSQAPVMRGINDKAAVWAAKWRAEVNLGIVPYYMFLARDTGAQQCFDVPLVEAHKIFTHAIQQVSGLSRTVRGPSMSCTLGKVEVLGVHELPTSGKAFVLRFIQGRDPAWVGMPFFAKFDAHAVWVNELVAIDGIQLPWDEKGLLRAAPSFNQN